MTDWNDRPPVLDDEAPAAGPAPAAAIARPPAGAAAGSLALPQPHVMDYVRIVYRRRATALAMFLITVVSVTVYTFTVTPVFEARTRLLIEAENPNVVSFQEVIDEGQAKADYYQTQYNILQSRVLARKTLGDLKLWDDPQFGGVRQGPRFDARAGLVWLVEVAPWASPLLDLWPVKAAAPAPDETAIQSRAIDAFLARLTVSPLRNSRLVDVKFRSTDPALAARVANAIAKSYIEQTLEYRFMASKEASDWLGERLAEQRKQVESAEAALQQYREQNDAIALQDRENIVVQKLADLNAAVTRAKTVRIEKESMYRQLSASQEAVDTFPAILANAFIQRQKAELADLQRQQSQMAEKLGARHPDMIKVESAIEASQARLRGEIAKVVASVRTEYQAALAQERSLVAALEQQKNEALAMNRKAIDYGVLARDVQSSQQLYETLLQRAKETGVAGELKTSHIRVVDHAEQPRAPVSPRRAVNLLLAVLAGAVLALGSAFSFEYLDNRIKTPDEIKSHLGVPALGFLPLLPKAIVESGHVLINNGVPPNFSEAFRAIRTNVLFSSADQGPRSLLITSSSPGEGKSMVAGNLAVALAQAGQRVLLIDADMRRPKVHRMFGQRQQPGLSNILVGNAKASDGVKKTLVQGLWLLPAGLTPPNPAELLGSARFREFLLTLHQHFDWVVLDSPPVMAVTDAAVLSHSVSGVLFVVGAEMTSRHLAWRALDQLDSAKARVVGAVLNRVDIDRNPYYYAQYYRREYTQYYAR